MILTESFLIFYLVWYFCMCVLYKDNWMPNKLTELGNKVGANNLAGGVILDLSECKFCMNFWCSTLAASVGAWYWIDYKYLIYGVFCTSITAWFKK